ncbi:MAG: glycosyltransferase family 4 protein, partial [Ruminococcaceae bacterium]|nr:glycosyltransferase family 4 protein [Oscillospiraceae bacterium]
MKRADQILADVQFGDAITDHAFALQSRLRSMGFQSEIYADNIHPTLLAKTKHSSEYQKGDLLLHHFAIGSELNERIKGFSNIKKIFIYHNITPPEFFEGYHLHSQTLCSQAREQLKTLSDTYDMSLAVSEYNCSELRQLGFRNLHVLPILYDFSKISDEYDSAFLQQMKDKTNILFLGRIAPNKKQEDVIKAFYLYHKIHPESRLFLVGSYHGMEKYLNE